MTTIYEYPKGSPRVRLVESDEHPWLSVASLTTELRAAPCWVARAYTTDRDEAIAAFVQEARR